MTSSKFSITRHALRSLNSRRIFDLVQCINIGILDCKQEKNVDFNCLLFHDVRSSLDISSTIHVGGSSIVLSSWSLESISGRGLLTLDELTFVLTCPLRLWFTRGFDPLRDRRSYGPSGRIRTFDALRTGDRIPSTNDRNRIPRFSSTSLLLMRPVGCISSKENVSFDREKCRSSKERNRRPEATWIGRIFCEADSARLGMSRESRKHRLSKDSNASRIRQNLFVRAREQWLIGVTSAVLLQCCIPAPYALAEDELSDAISAGRTSVDTRCFVNECKPQLQACLADKSCIKGTICSAKCAGDNLCIQGCFGKYGNKNLENFFHCTLEEKKCFKFDLGSTSVNAGPDSLESAALPPTPVVENFDPISLEGEWYKVLGWNPLYDCFDCQKNSFETSPRDQTLNVNVSFDIPIPNEAGSHGGALGKLNETTELLVFDPPGSKRTASTQGELFGVSFWENWYVIGQNKEDEPEYKFVYYNGHTIQNSYEGAFIYARTPELPEDILQSLQTTAKNAGMDLSSFCRIQNQCFVMGRNSPQPRKSRLSEDIRDLLEDPKERGQWLVKRQERLGH